MNKKSKIIVSCATIIGAVLSLGVSIALYKIEASPASMDFTAKGYTPLEGAVTYKLDGQSGTGLSFDPEYVPDGTGDNGEGLSDLTPQILYDIPLGAEFTGTGVVAQDIVVGKLLVNFTNIGSDLLKSGEDAGVKVYAEISGYDTGTLGEHYYKDITKSGDASDLEFTATSHKLMEKDIAVKTDGTQHLKIYVKFQGQRLLKDFDIFSKDEATIPYDLSISWGPQSTNFKNAYVVGAGNNWGISEDWEMVPEIGKEYDAKDDFGWVRYHVDGNTIGKSKACNHDKSVHSAGDDFTPTADTTYTYYWNGKSSTALSAQAETA